MEEDLEWFNKAMRNALCCAGCSVKMLATERLCLNPGKLGVGLMNVWMEWTKELIRTWSILKNTREEATMRNMEEFEKSHPKKGLLQEAKKGARMVVKKEEIEELLRTDMEVDKVIEKLEEKHEEKLLDSLKEKRQGEHWKKMELPNIQRKHTIQARQRMNIKKGMWKRVMLLQMGSLLEQEEQPC